MTNLHLFMLLLSYLVSVTRYRARISGKVSLFREPFTRGTSRNTQLSRKALAKFSHWLIVCIAPHWAISMLILYNYATNYKYHDLIMAVLLL